MQVAAVWCAISITCAAGYGTPPNPAPLINRALRLPVAENDDIRFARLSTREGLSHNRVEHILQDDQGFLWFGTENGLNRFDGYAFKVFRHDTEPDSLSGVTVTALYKDRAGVLWIGVDQILNKFDRTTETFEHYRPESTLGVIFGVFQDQTGRIWVAANHGLASLDQATGNFTYYRHRPTDPSSLASDELRFAMQDRAGVLWLVSAAGLDSFDPRAIRISHHDGFKLAINAFWPDTRLYEDRNGLLWMFSSSGTDFATIDRNSGAIRRYSFDKKAPPALIKTGILSIQEDHEGVLWFGTGGNGLIRFDRRIQKLARYRSNPDLSGSLSNDFVFSLFEDSEGTMWAGTGGGGVSHFPRTPLPFRKYQHDPVDSNSLKQNYVISVYPDSRGLLWIGNDKVLNCLDRVTGRYVFYRHNPADPESISMASVTSVVEDPAGFLWFGTYGGGLNRFDRRTNRFTSWRSNSGPNGLSSDLIFTLMLDRDGALWIGTDDGLDRFDLRTQSFKQFHQGAPVPTLRIIQDPEGWLWLGTMGGGLYSFDPQSGRFTGYRQDYDSRTGLSDNHVKALHVDHSGILWVGTQNGLDTFDLRKHKFLASYHEQDGLPDNVVNAIEEDNQGNLWISTSKGLSRLQPRTRVFTNFYDLDGLPGNDFSVLFPVSAHSSSGEMFFGGVDGLTSFYPDRVDQIDNRYVPPVVLTDFRINNVLIMAGQGLALPKAARHEQQATVSYQQDRFTFGFSALSYVNPARNRYRYKLDGLESAWTEVRSDRRFVTYANVPPGDYVFHVQGSNNSGIWNEDGVTVGIRVLPPWWRTWWFRLAAVSALLLTALLLYQLRLRRVTGRLNLAFEERLAERTRIARDFHDTLLQSFQGVLLNFHAVTYLVPDRPEARQAIENVVEQARHAIIEGRNAVEGLRSSKYEGSNLEAAVSEFGRELAARLPEPHSPDFLVNIQGMTRGLTPIVANELYFIATEAVRNAFQHARARRIEVEIEYHEREFRLRVRDNGKGVDPKVLEAGRDGHYGIAGMRERTRLAGGRLVLWSEIDSGTELELTIPASLAYAKVTLPGLPTLAAKVRRIFS
jgi:ligand-binding sensor domain-containing protein/signal transduction histidine kinase